MTSARQLIVPTDTAGHFHCVQRCVRRAFLCGVDDYTGRSFEHRRAWIETRLFEVVESFAVALHAYAVMANHLHVVLTIDPQLAQTWADAAVARRWVALFPPREDSIEARDAKQQVLLGNAERLSRCRQRLGSLSWFMRCLAEPIARRANREDQVSGRFWQGRYRCQALLDQRAVLAAMAYVDLNPIRAGIAERLEDSAHTSVLRRIADAESSPDRVRQPMPPVAGSSNHAAALTLANYLDLLDWTGRQIRPGKRGAIAASAPPVLAALRIDSSRWTIEVQAIGSRWWRAVGGAADLLELAQTLGQRWMKGIGFARALGLN